jgi:hypothetical protein
MKDPVIAAEVADGMVSDWAASLDVTLSDDGKSRIARAVMSGRLDYDGSKFAYILAAPVTLENGTKIEKLEISEPTAAQLREASKANRDQMDTAMRLLSGVSGQPLAVIDRLKQRDVMLLSELVGFFG